MPVRLPPLNALRVFDAAARHMSFKKAGDELRVTPTAVSHQIKLLEDFFGVALFRRLTRSLELTPQGEALLPKVREGLACFAQAVERLHNQGTYGPLIVIAPPSFAGRWLVPRLKLFSEREPKITLHLISSLATVDSDAASTAPGRESPSIREDSDHAFIRYGTGSYPGMRVDPIFAPDYIAVCSPALLIADHPLKEPSDIRFHTLIHDDTVADGRARANWADWLQIAGIGNIDTSSGPHFGDSVLALSAALAGQGIALTSLPLVADEIEAGRLVSPFSVRVSHPYAYYLVVPDALAERPAVKAFRKWILGISKATNKARRP